MVAKLVPLDSWFAVLAIAARGGRLWYHAPLDVRPVPVYVVRVYKNNKMRISGPGLTFTVDEGHLDRFRMKEGHH